MMEFVPIIILRILVHAKLVSEEIAVKKVRNDLVSENQCNVNQIIPYDNFYNVTSLSYRH